MKGTARRTKLELAEDLESRAASLSFSSDASDPVGVDISRRRALARPRPAPRRAGRGALRAGVSRTRSSSKEKKRLVGVDPPAAGPDVGPGLRGGDAPDLSARAPAPPPDRRGADRAGGGARAARTSTLLRASATARRSLALVRRRRRRRRPRPRPRWRRRLRLLAPRAARRHRCAGGAAGRARRRDRRDARQGQRRRRPGAAVGPDAHGPGLPRLLAGQLRARPVLADLAARRARARHRGPDLRDPLGLLGDALRRARSPSA